MTRNRWRWAAALGVAAGLGALAWGVPPWWSLAIAAAAPLLPGFLVAAVAGATTPGAREVDARDEMSGTEFEDHVARIARSVGVPVIMTPLSGDWGVDLIVGHRPDRLAVQCKRQSRPVGTSAVQEVVAGAPMQDCTRTMVVTNHHFTPAARKLAELHGCELVGADELPRLRSTIRRLTRPIEPTST
ncbi:restriction endonuclease [Mycolicibacterium sp. 018/SC-01/001]|uniref:restriction endonuclease n=1 Tax=Mycolicibacterium sp. 018/SC-01/001 TaxID=2592069 RepID=UPI00117DF05C|nr:restriction endonuclease [Mycolicibacterium sp. 018/SC-01/001]TRW78336.1 restriction endonuclease [Mycolicibacterium sp. 018/SC-01/001]